jgi:hypothetical protein
MTTSISPIVESSEEQRRHPGMFKPGVSGNPTGRPKSDVTIRELAKSYTESALATLVEIAQNQKAPPSARVHAACALLDRGWGKPAQFVESLSFSATLQDYLQEIADREKEERHVILEVKAPAATPPIYADDHVELKAGN